MFKFKGVSNESMRVIPIEENFNIRANRRYNEIQIEGRDGSIFEEIGYDNVVGSLELQILNMKRKDEILEWLSGSGDLEYEGRIAKMTIYESVAIQRSGAIYTANINYIRSPFWDTANDHYIKAVDVISNYGNIYSQPVICLKGENKSRIDLTLGNVRFQYTFDEDNIVEIDCETKEEYFNGKSKSKNIEIGFQYPKLLPGINRIVIHSGNVEIKVKRKDRWL